MIVSKITAAFPCELAQVWDIVTSLEHYSWRSDLSKIEVPKPGRTFIEHTPEGYSTTFTITAFEPMKRYAFDLENSNMTGHWIGLFSYQDGETTIEFTEHIAPKKWFMKPFASMYLKKQQALYIEDLKRALSSRS